MTKRLKIELSSNLNFEGMVIEGIVQDGYLQSCFIAVNYELGPEDLNARLFPDENDKSKYSFSLNEYITTLVYACETLEKKNSHSPTLSNFSIQKAFLNQKINILFHTEKISSIKKDGDNVYVTIYSCVETFPSLTIDFEQYKEILQRIKKLALKCTREDEEAGNKHWENQEE